MENLKAQIKFLHEIEAQETLEEAEEQAQKIITEAEEKAERIRKQKMQEVEERVSEKETSELALTKLEGKKKILDIKSQLLEEAITKSADRLREIADSGKSTYKEGIERLIAEGSMKLKGNEFQILANQRDRKLVKDSLRELEKKISKTKGASIVLELGEETLTTLGGVIVRTRDGRQLFNNTLEARLAKVRQEMVGEISKVLMEGVKD